MLFGDSSPFPEQLGLGPEASVGRCVGDSCPRHQDSQPSPLPRGGRACPAGRRGSRTLPSRLPFPRSLRPARPGPDLRAPASSSFLVTAAVGLSSPSSRFSFQFEKPRKETGKNVAMKAENRCRRPSRQDTGATQRADSSHCPQSSRPIPSPNPPGPGSSWTIDPVIPPASSSSSPEPQPSLLSREPLLRPHSLAAPAPASLQVLFHAQEGPPRQGSF